MQSACLRVNGSKLSLTADGLLEFSYGTHRWENNGILAVLHYYDRQHPREQVVMVPSSESYAFGTAGTTSLSCRGTFDITEVCTDHLCVVMHLNEIQLQLTLVIAIQSDGSGFTVTVDEEAIREDKEQLYRILGIELLPEFGAATTGEQGYLLLPNWFGCQCFFDKHYPREVWQTVYSSNDQWEHVCNMPVFGITRAQGTLCGLITDGDTDAQLVCRQHWESAQHNSIHPYLVYRWQQQDARIAGRRQVQYSFAPPEYTGGEGYVFCAKTYRELLLRRGMLNWEQKAEIRPEASEYIDRFFLKIFMAYKDPQADGHGQYHTTCTFDEARQIVQRCLDHGMRKLTVILVGWGQDGHDGKCPTYLPPDERLGGETSLRNFIDWCNEQDILLGVHTSHNGAYRCSEEFSEDDLIHHRTGEAWTSVVWSGGESNVICPKVAVEKFVQRDIAHLAALGLHGHHHYDAVGSFMPCYSPKHPVEQRADFINYVRQQFKIALDVMGSVSTEMPFGPYFDLVDGFFHSYIHPFTWHLASPIGRYFYDKSVPLLSVTLHGYVNCCMPLQPGIDYQLEMLDMGTNPQTEVCMRPSWAFGIAAFDDAEDILAQQYHFFYGENGLATRLSRLTIEGRWDIAPGISKTVFDDGTQLVINRTSEAYQGIDAKSYCLLEVESRRNEVLTGVLKEVGA